VSSIGILNSPFAIAMIVLVLGTPCMAIGAMARRKHRIWGAGLAAAVGWGLWLLGWLYFTDNL